MKRFANEDYKHFIRMAYQASQNSVRVTVPDKIHFSSQVGAWVQLRDQHTLVLSPNPSKGAQLVHWRRNDTIPGCREISISNVRHIGPHFRVQPVKYVIEGHDIAIQIPDEEERYLPRKRGVSAQQKLEPIAVSAAIEVLRSSGELVSDASVSRVLSSGRIEKLMQNPTSLEPTLEQVTITGLGSKPLCYSIPTERAIDLLDELSEYRVRD